MQVDFLLLLARRILGGAGSTSLPRSHRQGRRPTRSRGAQLSHKTYSMAGTVRPIFLPYVSQPHVP